MPKVALYARYSTDNQSVASIEDQFRICREHAGRERWHVIDTYHDAAISGASVILRITAVDGPPDIEAALKDPGAQQIQASASQDPFFMARRAVQIGVSILNGQKPASTVELLPSKLVTRDNVAEYMGWTSDRSQ